MSELFKKLVSRLKEFIDMFSDVKISEILEVTKAEFIKWADCALKVKIHAIHYIPFRDMDSEVYIFFETYSQLKTAIDQGMTNAISEKFSQILYSKSGKLKVRMEFDCHENVVENYKGSYFFRLR